MRLLYFYKVNILIINIFILCTLIELNSGYPLKKDTDVSDMSNETTYPNGTVVGRYDYKDNEGNPVHVRYFADASGYGVELKTIKMSTPDKVLCHDKSKLKYILRPDEELDSTTTTLSPMSEYLMSSKPSEGLKISDPKYKTNSDYEIFVNNELKTPKSCRQDKVHVYHEKNKRKSRQTVSEFDALKYCEQMFS